jgi:hypothetical protein
MFNIDPYNLDIETLLKKKSEFQKELNKLSEQRTAYIKQMDESDDNNSSLSCIFGIQGDDMKTKLYEDNLKYIELMIDGLKYRNTHNYYADITIVLDRLDTDMLCLNPEEPEDWTHELDISEYEDMYIIVTWDDETIEVVASGWDEDDLEANFNENVEELSGSLNDYIESSTEENRLALFRVDKSCWFLDNQDIVW